MTERQKEAWQELVDSARHVGWTYGYEGTPIFTMLTGLGGQVGCSLPNWMATELIAGHDSGREDREKVDRRVAELREADESAEPIRVRIAY